MYPSIETKLHNPGVFQPSSGHFHGKASNSIPSIIIFQTIEPHRIYWFVSPEAEVFLLKCYWMEKISKPIV